MKALRQLAAVSFALLFAAVIARFVSSTFPAMVKFDAVFVCTFVAVFGSAAAYIRWSFHREE
jgi:hypothetical protein